MSYNSFRSLVLITTLSGLVCFATPFLSPRPAFSETPKASTSISREDSAALRAEMKLLYEQTKLEAEKAAKDAHWARDYTNTGLVIISLIIGAGAILAAFFTIFYRGALRGVARRAEERAITKIEEARELSARFSEFILIGLQRLNDEHYESAVEAFSKALAIDDRSAFAWNGKGWALKKLGDLEGALGGFEKAHERDREYVFPLYNMARVYSLQRKRQKMLDALKGTFELDATLKENIEYVVDFESYQDDTAFQALIGGEEPIDEETL